jgi:hypothetical protein
MDCEPLTSSDADTVTAVPLCVPPLMYPAELVTDGVTVRAWLLTADLVAVGVPSVPLLSSL